MLTKLTRRRRAVHHTHVVLHHAHPQQHHTMVETAILLSVLGFFCCIMCVYYVRRANSEATYQVDVRPYIVITVHIW